MTNWINMKLLVVNTGGDKHVGCKTARIIATRLCTWFNTRSKKPTQQNLLELDFQSKSHLYLFGLDLSGGFICIFNTIPWLPGYTKNLFWIHSTFSAISTSSCAATTAYCNYCPASFCLFSILISFPLNTTIFSSFSFLFIDMRFTSRPG